MPANNISVLSAPSPYFFSQLPDSLVKFEIFKRTDVPEKVFLHQKFVNKMSSKVMLKSNDDWFLEVDVKAAKMLQTIKDMLEEFDMNNDNKVIPLHSIDGHTLMKVVEWMEHHKNDPPPQVNPPQVEIDIYDEPRTDDLSEWDGVYQR
ncbi:hypothetical protein KQX54_011084 [Cotesia glomerata]|uniref:SKP1 component POZ domain-containing protein n=1 Tax=Cotesia glomerata TaxID=32391 RepID=A0AAV7J766_COTGL|nr:hypothetical protein KQX54_011084 [Cotesia glomerata]